MSSGWRWAAASLVGTSHQRTGAPLQDAYAAADSGRWLTAIVCDGAGTAEYGRQGAWLAARTFTSSARRWLANQNELPTSEVVHAWIDDARVRISNAASRRGVTDRAFASTLSACIAGPSGFIIAQIGDSVIALKVAGDWLVPCWPQQGEYASSTYFITDAEPQVSLVTGDDGVDAIAAFSDGLDAIALNQASQSPHLPFLDPMIRPVAALPSRGRDALLSRQLRSFLATDRVCDRTDDDKTLILASLPS